MFGRKILFLAAGYFAGNVVASIYGNKGKKTKKIQSKEDVKSMLENFLDTQKNFLTDIEKKYISDENRELLAKKKEEFWKFAEKYIQQWESLLQEIKNNEKVQNKSAQVKKTVWKGITKGKKLLADIGKHTSKK